MTTIIIAVIAAVVAVASLILSILQWRTRHRPYIGVVNLDWDTIYEEHISNGTAYPDSVRCTVKNVGETPAKAIKFEGKVSAGSHQNMKELDLSILFPGQEVEVVLPFDVGSNKLASDFVAGYGGARVSCRIDYDGVLTLQHYYTRQHFAITNLPTRWLALPGGECS